MYRIGIQGERGSTNERAAKHFAQEYGWDKFEICPLRTTQAVLSALHSSEIDYGTFAWESSRAGLVAETQEAIKDYSYSKVSEVVLEIDHALLARDEIRRSERVLVYSHPQALKEHGAFLHQYFSNVELCAEKDTAYAAERLSNGEYPANSLVIAPKGCAELYALRLYLEDLPSNRGYWTKIFLVTK